MAAGPHEHFDHGSEDFGEAVPRSSGKGGVGLFLVSLVLGLPSLLAFYSSWLISRGGSHPLSAVWFLYEISLNIGFIAAAVAAGLTVIVATRRTISVTFICLMGMSVAGSIFMLWYAGHIFRSPW